MLSTVAASLELDIMQANEMPEAFELAVKYRIPSMIIHPDLTGEAMRVRAIRQGRFRIITPVDWPKGELYSMAKLQSMKIDALSTDGYEILLSNKQHVNEVKNEIKVLTRFIRDNLSPLAEVRIILGSFMREEEEIVRMLEALNGCPAPTFIRNDFHTKAPQNKANAKIHKATLSKIREYTKAPIKLSGNVTMKIIAGCQDATRFGVNLRQAQSIIKEANQDPEKLHKLMSAGISEEED